MRLAAVHACRALTMTMPVRLKEGQYCRRRRSTFAMLAGPEAEVDLVAVSTMQPMAVHQVERRGVDGKARGVTLAQQRSQYCRPRCQ